MKRLILPFVLLSLLISIERFCRIQTGGFRLQKATTCHVYPYQDISPTIPKEAQQSFSFLGSGTQCYVFLGEDQETILKLFKHHHFGPSTGLLKKLFPATFTKSIITQREKRMEGFFESASIAFHELSKQTGVFYLHLGKTDHLLGTTSITDNLGIKHSIDLDQTEFILQKKVETADEKLRTLFRNGQVDLAIDSMKDLLLLIESRSKKGIKNKDGNLLENCGFLDREPLEIDIGSFIYRKETTLNPNPHKKAVINATLQLLGFVKKNYPEHLKQCRGELLHENIL